MIVKNVVSELPSDKTDKYTFIVTLSDTSISKDYNTEITKASETTESTITFTNGTSGEIKLADGESIKIKELPTGMTATVAETKPDNMTTTYQIGAAAANEGISAAGVEAGQTVTFTNIRDKVTVKLHKKVSGNMGDRSRTFYFDIVVKDKNDIATVKTVSAVPLKDWDSSPNNNNEWVCELPVGARVTISERDPSYTGGDIVNSDTTVERNGVKVADGLGYTFSVPSQNCIVTYVNNLEVKIDTGVTTDSKPYLFLLGLIPLVGVGAILMARKRRRDEA